MTGWGSSVSRSERRKRWPASRAWMWVLLASLVLRSFVPPVGLRGQAIHAVGICAFGFFAHERGAGR